MLHYFSTEHYDIFFFAVCNLHPQDQEQMPVEESGNMVGANL